MKNLVNWQVALGLVLVSVSLAVYFIHYSLFHDARLLIKDFIEYTAFFFIQIMLATLIIDKLLNFREKQDMLKKMNMVIGMFYSEVGTEFLKRSAAFDITAGDLVKKLHITTKWTDKDFDQIVKWVGAEDCVIDIMRGDLEGMKTLLVSKRNFLLMLLENPNLLEHEAFTDVLWAVFHLSEELSARIDLRCIKPSDAEHIAIDIKRAYVRATMSWISYMKHLKHDYPYLFSFAVRTNPFDPTARVEITMMGTVPERDCPQMHPQMQLPPSIARPTCK
jgi:hypothetical protein